MRHEKIKKWLQISKTENTLWGSVVSILFILSIILVLFIMDFFIGNAINPPIEKNTHDKHDKEEFVRKYEPAKSILTPFENTNIEASSVFVYDIITDRVLYSRNEYEVLPLASVTKLMTALIADSTVPKATTIEIESADIAIEGDSGLLVGEKWKLKDLIDYTLMVSSNDGASAIATVVGSLGQSSHREMVGFAKNSFIESMNEKSKEIGLLDTYFLNESGLDLDKETGGAYGTAKDVAVLMTYIIKNNPSIIQSTAHDKASFTTLNRDGQHIATNTNNMLSVMPNIIASKTGFTDLAGGNLVVVFDAGIMRPIVVVVLGSSIDGRFTDVQKLINASLESLKI